MTIEGPGKTITRRDIEAIMLFMSPKLSGQKFINVLARELRISGALTRQLLREHFPENSYPPEPPKPVTAEPVPEVEINPEPQQPANVIELRSKPFRTVRDIKLAVCKRYKITMREMESPCRAQRLSVPRQIAMALAYKRLKRFGYSLPMIGREFGDRDHTTVIHALRKYGIQAVPHGTARALRGVENRKARAIAQEMAA